MSRLIIKNLPKSITEEQLRKQFSEKGEISDVQLKYTSKGVFRRFGFVGYKTEEQANEAITFFNNTYLNTNKITVELCANLGDANKPKSWSKYAHDSTIYKKEHSEKTEEEPEPKLQKSKRKIDLKEIISKYKDDPMFEVFMELHGTKDISVLVNKLEETETVLNLDKNKEIESTKVDNEDAESTEESDEKLANEKISDLDYMKLLMAKSLEKKSGPRKRMEKQQKQPIKLYTVKLLGLPYSCKKKDIKQFIKPLVPYTIRIPTKSKGFAYIGFKTEKSMNEALHKHKSFLGGKQISVIPSISKESKEINEAHDNQSVIKKKWIDQEEALKIEENIAESGRIFIRNLSYTTTENDIQTLFEKYGPITEVNLPIDQATRKLKGFGVVTFLMPEHAVKAYSELDGCIFQGRLLHLLPAKMKDTPDNLQNMDDLSYKKKKAIKDKAQAGSSHNWNSLFMGHNAVADVIADTYGTNKEAVLDGRGKGSAAVRLALGETQIVAQTKQYLEDNGVHLDVFTQPIKQRSKTVILVKNLPAQTQAKEIQELFTPFGLIGRVILPPSGVTALVEFLEPYEARKAFTKLAYSKFKSGPLYLEWAPENTFKTPAVKNSVEIPEEEKLLINKEITKKEETMEEREEMELEEEPEPDTTLFVKNLNFSTTEAALRKHFEPCGKLNYVNVATRKDPKNSKNKLSMGYGFIRFHRKADADKALKTLQHSVLEEKTLELKRSERTLQNDVHTTRKNTNVTKQTSSKILVKNVPFQAKHYELLELFKAFGEIKSLRLPKKMTLGAESHRGFAFVDFVTKSDAKRAFEALSQSTHLYGRRLALEWAASDEGVDQIRKRTAEHFHHKDETRSKKSAIDTETFINS